MKLEIGERFPVTIETEGTLMDYVEDGFVFVIKDALWTPFELTALKGNALDIEYIYKYDVSVFLLTLQDAIDTSDFIFNIHDNEYPDSLWRSFEKGTGFSCTLVLLDASNIISGTRKIQLSSTASNIIAKRMKEQQDAPYHEDEFNCNLEGLQTAYEPFELQPFAIVSERFK